MINKTRPRIAATIEARMRSSRLPGKIMLPLCGKPLLSRLVERVRRSARVDDVIVATTVSPMDDEVEVWARQAGVLFYRGSEEDVLGRVLEAARAHQADIIVELTGDCPLLDARVIDEVIGLYLQGGADYVSNVLERTYPRGLDVQVFSTELLREVSGLTRDPADREHVSLYIYEHPEKYRLAGVKAEGSSRRPDLRLCVDTPADYEVIRNIYEHCYPKNPFFSYEEVLEFLNQNPRIAAMNAGVQQKALRP